MDRDFVLGARTFRVNKLDPFKQFHIARRIGPMLAEMIPAAGGAKSVKDFEKLSEAEKFDLFAKFAPVVMKGLAKMSNEDADFVLHGLLEAVELHQNPGYAKVFNPDAKMLMVGDLLLPQLLHLAGRSFMFNLSGFFDALP